MSAIGWFTAARRAAITSMFRRSRTRKPARLKLNPGLESLESIDLMSTGLVRLPAVATQGTALKAAAYTVSNTVQTTAVQTTTFQTVTVPNQATNFVTSFSPPLNKFDPTLGTLKAVHLNVSVNLTSQIAAQNTSTSSPADITAEIFTSGSNYAVSGLQVNGSTTDIGNTLGMRKGPVHVSAYNGTDPLLPPFGGNSTALWTFPPYPGTVPPSQTFSPLTATATQNFTLTSASDLAFYTASTGNTTITPQLTENGFSGASAPNGNLVTNVQTSGSGVITVSYDYEPACPTVVNLVRFGIHHQPTKLELTFSGPIVPANEASNPANYWILVPNRQGSFTGAGVTRVPVTRADYNQANNTVTLTTAQRLNVHKQFQLAVNLPCNNGNVIYIQFGGRNSLGGFTNPHAGNKFVPVVKGRIVKTGR